jgi:hypothetical protein
VRFATIADGHHYPKEATVDLTVEERVDSLEVDTYAGPGQNEVFSDNFLEIRKKLNQMGRVQGAHTRTLSKHTKMLTGLKGDVRTLKDDVATLKSDMVEVKGALAEILDRLPPRAA